MRVLFIGGKKKFCGSLKTLKFCKLQFFTLPTQKVADPWFRLPRLLTVDVGSPAGSLRRVDVGTTVDVSYVHAASIINNLQNCDFLMLG
jgi:hypothetical protein